MGLDVTLIDHYGDEVFSANITHNLGRMASAVDEDFYKSLWRPEEISCTRAKDIQDILLKGLQELASNQMKYEEFSPINGWGSWEDLLNFTKEYYIACLRYPNATIEVCR